jgi:parallel beta-helix repeat protein
MLAGHELCRAGSRPKGVLKLRPFLNLFALAETTRLMLFKKLLLTSFLLISINSYAVTVQGVALLSGAADHSGITVSFVPKSQSAVASSLVSLANGSYSGSIVAGVYDIKFSMAGYQDHIIVDQFISIDLTLNQVTLSAKPVVHVTGNVEGTWVNTNDYVIDGHITIQSGTELVIQEGTSIKFSGFFRFFVLGKLTAVGSKGQEIIFTTTKTSKARGDWGGISVSTTSDTTRLDYCQVEYGASKNEETALIHNTGNLIIRNSIVRGSAYGGIGNRGGGFVKIERTEVTDVYMYGIGTASDSKGATFYYNKVHHIDLIGVSCQPSTYQIDIVGNSIYNTGYHAIQANGNHLIERNLLYNNPYGVFVSSGKPIIKNNTIYKNGHGIGFYNSDFWHPSAIVTSNIIFQNNGYGIYCEGIYQPEEVEYNLISGNPSGAANRGPVGLGTVVTTNVYGYPADTYLNIFNDPGFFSIDNQSVNYLYLLPTSPAIDAGNPLLKDDDNSAVDCGAIPFQKYNQIVTFAELIEKTFGDPDFTLSASSSASLPVTFFSDNQSIAVIENNTVKIVGAGKVNITARQAGNSNYKLVEVIRELIVHKANQSITFPAIANKTLGDVAFLLSATSSAQLPVQYTSDLEKLSITSAVVSLLKAGRVTVQATQPGNENYKAAIPVEQSFCVYPSKPTISLDRMNYNKPVLSSSNIDGNQWYFNGTPIAGATAKNWEATEDGLYTVKSTIDDCESEISEAFVVVITGVHSELDELTVDVFPNPVLEHFTLTIKGQVQEEVEVTLVNSIGQVLHGSTQEDSEGRISMKGFERGIYLLRVKTNRGTIAKHVIKL